MKLYRFKYPFVIPARSEEEARDKLMDKLRNEDIAIEPDRINCVIGHSDFIKIFRLVRLLNSIEQYEFEHIRAIVNAYVISLGYYLTEDELWEGILIWGERFDDTDDEDIEEAGNDNVEELSA